LTDNTAATCSHRVSQNPPLELITFRGSQATIIILQGAKIPPGFYLWLFANFLVNQTPVSRRKGYNRHFHRAPASYELQLHYTDSWSVEDLDLAVLA
jgi:hypothetical protein